MPQTKKRPAEKEIAEQKAQQISTFTKRGATLEKQLSDEYITLNGIDRQISSHNFVLSENAGKNFAEKYDLVPGNELYNIMEDLKKIEFENMTERQKQMVMLILFYGIFMGVYQTFLDMPALSIQQNVALNMMGQDVNKVKSNIVPVLQGIEKNGVDEKLKKRFHDTFDVYHPEEWGPRKSCYDVVHATNCAEWSEDPDKNRDKILAHKDYMLSSLVPDRLPALFCLMHAGVVSSLNSNYDVNYYFVDFRSVNNINVLIGFLRNYHGRDDAYVLPSANLWIQNMYSGMQQSFKASEHRISELTNEQKNWAQTIDKMYKQLPTLNPANSIATEKGK